MKNAIRNFMFKFGGVIASLALFVTAYNVNVACCFISHQPKLPEGAKKLRKF